MLLFILKHMYEWMKIFFNDLKILSFCIFSGFCAWIVCVRSVYVQKHKLYLGKLNLSKWMFKMVNGFYLRASLTYKMHLKQNISQCFVKENVRYCMLILSQFCIHSLIIFRIVNMCSFLKFGTQTKNAWNIIVNAFFYFSLLIFRILKNSFVAFYTFSKSLRLCQGICLLRNWNFKRIFL